MAWSYQPPANDDPDLRPHMLSLGHNELSMITGACSQRTNFIEAAIQ